MGTGQDYDPRYQRPATPPQWQTPAARQRYAPQGQWDQQDYSQPQPYPGRYPQQAPPPQRHRQRSRWPMGIIAAVAGIVVLALAGAGFYVTHNRASAGPLTCAQQYANWKNGPAYSDGKQLEASLSALSAAGKSEDIPEMDSDLKTMGTEAAALESYPMPQCADPAGYWAQALADMKAAGDNAGSASGFSGLILAEAPLKNVPSLEEKLDAELAKTAGVKAG